MIWPSDRVQKPALKNVLFVGTVVHSASLVAAALPVHCGADQPLPLAIVVQLRSSVAVTDEPFTSRHRAADGGCVPIVQSMHGVAAFESWSCVPAAHAVQLVSPAAAK